MNPVKSSPSFEMTCLQVKLTFDLFAASLSIRKKLLNNPILNAVLLDHHYSSNTIFTSKITTIYQDWKCFVFAVSLNNHLNADVSVFQYLYLVRNSVRTSINDFKLFTCRTTFTRNTGKGAFLFSRLQECHDTSKKEDKKKNKNKFHLPFFPFISDGIFHLKESICTIRKG